LAIRGRKPILQRKTIKELGLKETATSLPAQD